MLFASDYPRQVVAEQVRRHEWRRIDHGAYLPAKTTDPAALALARMISANRRTNAPHWFNRESAALLSGLPLRSIPAMTHLRQSTRPAANRSRSVFRHVGPVELEDRAIVNGLPVTGLALTVVDCLRVLPPVEALAVADAAVRAGADVQRIAELLDRAGRSSGTAVARTVFAVTDPGAESPTESAVRFYLLAAGLPRPQTQVPVTIAGRTYWGDLGFPEWKILIEYDGRPKYDNPEVFFRERERQADIESEGWSVIRLTYKDLHAPADLVAKVRRRLPPGIPHTPRPHLNRPRSGSSLR